MLALQAALLCHTPSGPRQKMLEPDHVFITLYVSPKGPVVYVWTASDNWTEALPASFDLLGYRRAGKTGPAPRHEVHLPSNRDGGVANIGVPARRGRLINCALSAHHVPFSRGSKAF